MAERTWLITGVSSGFGRHLTEQLLDRGDRVVGTVRRLDAVADLVAAHPHRFRAEPLDVRDTSAMRAAEELSDEQIEAILATNLTGSIQLIRAVLPHMRGRRRTDHPTL